MAARVGVQQSVVSAYEGRAREPSLATPSSPVEACGVTLELHPGDELPTRARPGGADRLDADLLGAGPRYWRRPLGTA